MSNLSVSRNEIAEKIVRPCIETACATIPNVQVPADLNSLTFYGEEAAILDSLNLVSFIFLLESKVTEVFKIEIKFSTEDILDTEQRPFLNLAHLVQFLEKKINEAA